MIFKILLSRSVQTPNSDKNWQTSWLLQAFVCNISRHLTHFVTHRPSDPGIQRPGDPVDPVTLFYNEHQMLTYVADKRLQWARGLPVFITVWRLHASGK